MDLNVAGLVPTGVAMVFFIGAVAAFTVALAMAYGGLDGSGRGGLLAGLVAASVMGACLLGGFGTLESSAHARVDALQAGARTVYGISLSRPDAQALVGDNGIAGSYGSADVLLGGNNGQPVNATTHLSLYQVDKHRWALGSGESVRQLDELPRCGGELNAGPLCERA